MAESKPKKTILKIDLDTSLTDVLKYDKEGLELSFETSPERFKHLGKEIVEALSRSNKKNYWVSYGMMRKEKDDLSSTPQIQINPRYASANTQFEFNVTDPGFKAKYTCSWLRPEQTQSARVNGYTFVEKSDPIECFNRDSQGRPIVGVTGAVEQVLMKIPTEIYVKRKNAARAESMRRGSMAEDKIMAILEEAGGKPHKIEVKKEKVQQ